MQLLKQSKTILWLVICSCMALSYNASAAPKAKLIPYWKGSDEINKSAISHKKWQDFLARYAKSHKSGVNRVDYAGVNAAGKQQLESYLNDLQAVAIRSYNRNQQFAYWVNLYNAATVKVILDHYPVKSIKDVSFGLFSFGPWDEKLLKVEKQPLSLNDIEHGILRPIWKDRRIHYVVNCASIGCPNLLLQPMNANSLESQLKKAEKAYVRHPRGFSKKGNVITLSSIYDWYQVDFGSSAIEVVKSLIPLITTNEDKLEEYKEWLDLPASKQEIKYQYDWALNKK